MKHHYRDIRDRIPTDPLWWDEVGVPRYCDFGPRATNDIYAREAVLLEVACQNCRQRFKVALSWSESDRTRGISPLSERVEQLHYGDPPNVGCCPSGPTMNSIPIRVLEFWQYQESDWQRVAQLEIVCKSEWDDMATETNDCC